MSDSDRLDALKAIRGACLSEPETPWGSAGLAELSPAALINLAGYLDRVCTQRCGRACLTCTAAGRLREAAASPTVTGHREAAMEEAVGLLTEVIEALEPISLEIELERAKLYDEVLQALEGGDDAGSGPFSIAGGPS